MNSKENPHSAATVAAPPPASTSSDRPEPWHKRVRNWLWGYDFFISYNWKSGGKYAVNLAEQLRQRGFDCFLDRSEFAMGDDWKLEASRALRNTQRLIVIATREAVTISQSVAHEVFLFSGRRNHIIPIVFVDDFPNGEPFTGSQALNDHDRINSRTLSLLPDTKIHIKERASHLDARPDLVVIDELAHSHRILRRRSLRLRVVTTAITLLSLSAVVAISFAVVAEYQRSVAQRRLDGLRNVTEAAIFELHDVIQSLPGAVHHRENLVKRTLPYLDQLNSENPDDETVLRTLAVGYLKLGDLLGHPEELSLGRTTDALEAWRKAESVVAKLRDKYPASPRYQHDQALLIERFSLVEAEDGHEEAARRRFGEALAILRNVAKVDHQDWTVARDTARMMMRIGDVERSSRLTLQASQHYHAASDLVSKLLESSPDNRILRGDLASILYQFAEMDRENADITAALTKIDNAVRHRQTLEKDDPYDANNTVQLANLYALRGDCLRDSLRSDDAIAAYETAIRVRQAIHEKEPRDATIAANLATDFERLGATFGRSGLWEDAVIAYEKSSRIREGLIELAPNDANHRLHLSIALERLADSRKHLPQYAATDAVETLYRRALAIRRDLLKDSLKSPRFRHAVASSERQLGRFLLEADRPLEEAMTRLREAYRLLNELHMEFPDDLVYGTDAAETMFLLADAMIRLERPSNEILQMQRGGLESLQSLTRSHSQRTDILKTLLVAENRIADYLMSIAENSKDSARASEEAIKHYEEALKIISRIESAGGQLPGLEDERQRILEQLETIRQRP